MAITTCLGQVEAIKKYGIMVDAGSSGSRIHLYTWESRLSKTEVPKITEPTKLTKLKGGISNYASNPSDAYKTIVTLLETLYKEADFTKDQESNTPFYLFATAGMRLLPQATSTEIMNSIRKYIKANTNFIFDDDHVQVIPGNHEALYGWLQLNYAMGSFSGTNEAKTYGAMDLGGASTQLTYALPQSFQMYEDGMFVRVGKQKYKLYATSFLRYGLTEAFNLAIEEYVADQKLLIGNYTYPCFNTGYSTTVGDDFLRGTSSPENCTKIVRQILHLKDFCPEKQSKLCGIAGEYMPDISALSMSFFGFSAFANVAEGVNLLDKNGEFQNDQYLKAIAAKQQEFCSYTWEELKENTKTIPDYLNTVCFGITYMHELYSLAYRFQENLHKVKIVHDIPGSNIEAGWALGALIHQISLIDVSLNIVQLPQWLGLWMVYVLSLVIVLCCLSFFILCVLSSCCNLILLKRLKSVERRDAKSYRYLP